MLTEGQLRAYAQDLAARHHVTLQGGPNNLLSRLNENEAILRAFNRTTVEVDRKLSNVTPAAEWLLDNAYLLDEQVLMARRHLPRRYSRELPRLAAGPSAGLPRVYDLVLEFISHVDAQLELKSLSALVAGYQEVQALKLGELWAVPIMLRLGLLENLRRIVLRLTEARADRAIASRWAERLQSALERPTTDLIGVVAEMARSSLPGSSAFVAELNQRFSRLGPSAQLARSWFEQRLSGEGRSIEQYVLLESQRQAADQVSVSHSIASLRLLATHDWKSFVEALSLVDQALRRDPAALYGAMDFATRDQYRHAVETIARSSDRTETEVAELAIAITQEQAEAHGRGDRRAHVGFHLIDDGRQALELAAGMRRRWRGLPERWICAHPAAFYMGGVTLITLLATAWLALEAHAIELQGPGLLLLLAAGMVGSSQLGVAVLNWLTLQLIKPRLLPRLDFSGGIPADHATMVVIPTILSGTQGINRLLEGLEVHYLANRDPHLRFALLTDFRDANTAKMPEDVPLLAHARAGIEQLNARHGPNRFYLFHRPRHWNAQEGVWMGYERKRGKLAEFNSLLRGRGGERFTEVVGDPTLLLGIRFVITLDSDTQLPRDTARRLVGTMAHPLNRPRIDPAIGVVTEGYGILQPRVGVSLSSS
ncbi:MAG: cyclic beta 1-2 glucan synthetase, partial [Verrucomicrobiae bacterium]|nr:cyclic beta 1-2 glucan synthetase [Verrucomicrobiae bacterium]